MFAVVPSANTRFGTMSVMRQFGCTAPARRWARCAAARVARAVARDREGPVERLTSWPGWFGMSPRGSENELICGVRAGVRRRRRAWRRERAAMHSDVQATTRRCHPDASLSLHILRRLSLPLTRSPYRYANIRSIMVVCVLIPRFELLTALGGRGESCCGRPSRWPPSPTARRSWARSRVPREALGIHPGMRLGEALARCPGLRLIPPDPERAARAWEAVLAGLEGIGAAVEPAAPGEAYFEAAGLRRMYGGHLEGVLARARRAMPAAGPAGRGARAASAPTPPRAARAPAAARRSSRRAPSGRSSRRSPVSLLPAVPLGAPSSLPGARAARHPHAGRAGGAARRAPSPTASARPGCARASSRSAATPPCARALRASASWRRSSCPRRSRACSSSARSSC